MKLKTIKHAGIVAVLLMWSLTSSAQVSISSINTPPHESAMLDVESSSRGFLPPRMTSAERDAISNPSPGLQIFNTETECLQFYTTSSGWLSVCGDDLCDSFSASLLWALSVSCPGDTDGSAEVLATGGVPPYSYSWTGDVSSNATASDLPAGLYVATVEDSKGCQDEVTILITTPDPLSVTVGSNSPVTTGSALNLTSAPLGGTAPFSYAWSGPQSFTSSDQNPVVNNAQTNQTGTYSLNLTDSRGCQASASTGVSVNDPWSCGQPLTISHFAGDVAPVSKTVSYGTVLTSISGSSKCWITQNLGADVQAASSADMTDAAAGWYWQFNRRKGWVNGSVSGWPNSLPPVGNWQSADDPCTLLLGSGWRLPTNAEMQTIQSGIPNSGAAFSSILKLHMAGSLETSTGVLQYRGQFGHYWDIEQASNTDWGKNFLFYSSSAISEYHKQHGFPVRCLK